jgi:hypothetical protein
MSMIRCKCKRDNDPWRCFCGACGAKLEPGCAACGFTNRVDDRFCGGCGRTVAVAAPTPVPRAPKLPALPRAPRRPPPPPAKSHTVPIERVDDAVLSEAPATSTGSSPPAPAGV